MAAPAGNQFWKLRSKHGRDTLFEDPELMRDEIAGFFNWVDGHPWYKVEQLKKPYQEDDGNGGKRWVTITKVPTARPYTIQGLSRYLNCNVRYFNDFERRIKDRTDQKSQDFAAVIAWAYDIIYQNKFEGAAVGAFNPTIISRDLGLREKTDMALGFGDGQDGEINIRIGKPKPNATDQH